MERQRQRAKFDARLSKFQNCADQQQQQPERSIHGSILDKECNDDIIVYRPKGTGDVLRKASLFSGGGGGGEDAAAAETAAAAEREAAKARKESFDKTRAGFTG